MNKNNTTDTRTTAAYLGPQGTFSNEAAKHCFPPEVELIPCETIEGIFEATESGAAHYGIVPVENSAQGCVSVTMDRCVKTSLTICGETAMPIRNALMSKASDMSHIKRIYSHPQPLLQCRAWLLANLSGVTQEALSSTAESAIRAADDPTAAAIGSAMLAELYRLNVLVEDIHDREHNVTRFWVLGHQDSEPTESDKTSLWFITPHKPGALYRVLKVFADTSVNIMRIESRPYPGKAWEYVFFLDLEGHRQNANLQKAFSLLPASVEAYRVLGSYPAFHSE
ncbi:MAG: prephenate dehydratase [Kiritimatiellae bacterium]|nr:prephenate dehydratase [Kiritimatiellia bacterium]